MYGLRKIIQIDGFIAGKRTVIELDGHSILNGTNGAGKSSTLKLLSFFYGSDPSQLYSSASVQKSFVQFYLPRHTSHLIFEYERESGLCCVAVYRHKNGTKHAYRFLEGGFSEEWFSHNDSSGESIYCNGYDLKMHWQQLGLNCSRQIEVVTDYRAVIQNDASLIGRLAGSRELRNLASMYCLGSRKTRMRYIERICATINNRSSNMHRMKDMLSEIMANEDLVLPETPIHRDDVGLIKEIRSLREFENEIPHMKNVVQQHDKRLDIEKQLASRAGYIKRAELDIDKDMGTTEQELEGMNGRLDQLRSEWESQYRDLAENTIKAEKEVESCEKEIERLDEQYDEYEQQDMDKKVSDYDNLGNFEQEEKRARERHIKLNDDVKEEENARNRSLNEEHERYERIRSAKQTKLDEVNDNLEDYRQTCATKLEDIDERQRSEINAIRDDASAARTKLIEAKAMAQAVAETGGPTEEEKRILAEINHSLERLEREVDTHRSALQERVNEQEKARNRQEQADEALGKARRNLNEEKDKLHLLHKFAFAEEGTWLQQLREKDSDWMENLGKIVNPDILQRKDIHAEHTGEDSDTVFGWTVNLQSLPTPHYAESEKQLRAAHSAQEDNVARAEKVVEERVKEYEKANKGYKEAEKSTTLAHTASQSNTDQIETVRNVYRTKSDEVNLAVSERRIEAKNDIKRLEKEIMDFDDALDKRINAATERHSEERLELKGSWSIEESRITQDKDRLLGELATLKETHVKYKNQIRDDFTKACSDKGVDHKTIENARKAADDAKAKVLSIHDSAADVNRYRQWLETEWNRRASLTTRLGELNAKKDHAENEKQIRKREHEQKVEELKADKKKVNSKLTKLREKQDQLNAIRPRYSIYMKDVEAVGQPKPFDLLIQEIQALLESNEKIKNELVDGVTKINGKLQRHEETQVGQAWGRRKENLRQQLGYDNPYERNFLISLPQILEAFVNDDVNSIRQARIESLRGAGKGLTDFFERLTIIHNRIRQQSRKITAAIEENMKIDALSSISISMNSRIDSLDYWKPLQGFSKSWQVWLQSGERDLPDKEFLDEMSSLIDMLKSIKSGSQLRDYFDLCIHMVENGHPRVIRSDHELDNSTSDGLKYLALCVIYIALCRLLCPDREVVLHWPIDELGTLHGDNIPRLFSMLNQSGIIMLAGTPGENPSVLRQFRHRQIIDFETGVRVIDVPESSLRDRAMARQNRQVMQ